MNWQFGRLVDIHNGGKPYNVHSFLPGNFISVSLQFP